MGSEEASNASPGHSLGLHLPVTCSLYFDPGSAFGFAARRVLFGKSWPWKTKVDRGWAWRAYIFWLFKNSIFRWQEGGSSRPKSNPSVRNNRIYFLPTDFKRLKIMWLKNYPALWAAAKIICTRCSRRRRQATLARLHSWWAPAGPEGENWESA